MATIKRLGALLLVVSPMVAVFGCKTGGMATTASTPMSKGSVARTLLQVHCKGADSAFDIRFNITGLQRDPELEADILMDVINNTNNEKVVSASAGRGFFSDKEYIYVRYAVGGLTMDWQEGQYYGAATVNADPETTAVEVKCDATPLTDVP